MPVSLKMPMNLIPVNRAALKTAERQSPAGSRTIPTSGSPSSGRQTGEERSSLKQRWRDPGRWCSTRVRLRPGPRFEDRGRSFCLAPFQHLAQSLYFLMLKIVTFQNVQNQGLMRVAEEAADQVTDLGTGSFFLPDPRLVYVRPAVLNMLHVTLAFQNTNRGKDGVIGESRLGRQPVQHLLHRARAFLPKHIHDAHFGAR